MSNMKLKYPSIVLFSYGQLKLEIFPRSEINLSSGNRFAKIITTNNIATHLGGSPRLRTFHDTEN